MIRAEAWVQIEAEARTCPVLEQFVQYVRSGHQTREDALVAAAIELSRVRRELLLERQRTLRMMQAVPGVPAALLG